jgi:hypothetical protein
MPWVGQGRPEHTPFTGRPKRVCVAPFAIKSRSGNSYTCNAPAGKVHPSNATFPSCNGRFLLEATTGWDERTCTPVCTFRRPTLDLKPEQVGLTLAEAKTLLAGLQAQLIRQQADEYATYRRVCPCCCCRMQPAKDYKCRQRTSRP